MASLQNRRSGKAGSKRPEAALLRRSLLRWYDRNRRDLPWRNTRDPYRIWLSEVMLQQTRVQAVLSYYDKFLEAFPGVAALAAADEPTLLASWSGLGYYSRARNMHLAAQKIDREWGGQFPRNYAEARELPGVGEYTARAVLSIAYGIPLAVVDGNVARVLSRLYMLPEDFRSGKGRRKFQALADALLAPRRPGDFNQAMMELGATVCLPRQPHCAVCPLGRMCLAYKQMAVNRYPPPRRAAKPRARRLVAVLIRDDAGRCLLVRRPKSAKLMAGFWELPMWELNPSHRKPSGSPDIPAELIVLGQRIGRVRHAITTSRFDITVHAARLQSGVKLSGSRWVAAKDLDRHPITTITRKALACGSSA